MSIHLKRKSKEFDTLKLIQRFFEDYKGDFSLIQTEVIQNYCDKVSFDNMMKSIFDSNGLGTSMDPMNLWPTYQNLTFLIASFSYTCSMKKNLELKKNQTNNKDIDELKKIKLVHHCFFTSHDQFPKIAASIPVLKLSDDPSLHMQVEIIVSLSEFITRLVKFEMTRENLRSSREIPTDRFEGPTEKKEFIAYLYLLNEAYEIAKQVANTYKLCQESDMDEPFCEYGSDDDISNSEWDNPDNKKLREENVQFHYTSLPLSYMLPVFTKKVYFLIRGCVVLYNVLNKRNMGEKHSRYLQKTINLFSEGVQFFNKIKKMKKFLYERFMFVYWIGDNKPLSDISDLDEKLSFTQKTLTKATQKKYFCQIGVLDLVEKLQEISGNNGTIAVTLTQSKMDPKNHSEASKSLKKSFFSKFKPKSKSKKSKTNSQNNISKCSQSLKESKNSTVRNSRIFRTTLDSGTNKNICKVLSNSSEKYEDSWTIKNQKGSELPEKGHETVENICLNSSEEESQSGSRDVIDDKNKNTLRQKLISLTNNEESKNDKEIQDDKKLIDKDNSSQDVFSSDNETLVLNGKDTKQDQANSDEKEPKKNFGTDASEENQDQKKNTAKDTVPEDDASSSNPPCKIIDEIENEMAKITINSKITKSVSFGVLPVTSAKDPELVFDEEQNQNIIGSLEVLAMLPDSGLEKENKIAENVSRSFLAMSKTIKTSMIREVPVNSSILLLNRSRNCIEKIIDVVVDEDETFKYKATIVMEELKTILSHYKSLTEDSEARSEDTVNSQFMTTITESIDKLENIGFETIEDFDN